MNSIETYQYAQVHKYTHAVLQTCSKHVCTNVGRYTYKQTILHAFKPKNVRTKKYIATKTISNKANINTNLQADKLQVKNPENKGSHG